MKKHIQSLAACLIVLLCPVLLQAKEVKFAVLSDMHYASVGEDKAMKLLASGKEITPKVLKEISDNKDIDFVVLTGDLLVDPYKKDLGELKELLDKDLKKPYYIIIGNHDLPMDKNKEDIGKNIYSNKNFFDTFHLKKGYWSTNVDGLHLIGLDSSRTDTWGGSISKEQVAWLKKDLAKNKSKPTVIFAHHAFLEFYPEMDLRKEFYFENYAEVLKILLDNPQVKFTVTGHYHFPAEIFRDGVHHFSAPSIITYPCKYAIFTVDDDNIDLKTVQVGDKAFVQKALAGLTKQKDWRDRFTTDAQMTNLFRGISSYSFEPRVGKR